MVSTADVFLQYLFFVVSASPILTKVNYNVKQNACFALLSWCTGVTGWKIVPTTVMFGMY